LTSEPAAKRRHTVYAYDEWFAGAGEYRLLQLDDAGQVTASSPILLRGQELRGRVYRVAGPMMLIESVPEPLEISFQAARPSGRVDATAQKGNDVNSRRTTGPSYRLRAGDRAFVPTTPQERSWPDP